MADHVSQMAAIFELIKKHEAVDMGLGIADCPPPDHVRKALADVAESGNFMLHQYTRSSGHPRLVNSIAKMYKALYEINIDPMTEVIVTAGGSPSLMHTFHSHVKPGEEVILIEPFFIPYEEMIKLVGGKPVYVPLRPTGTDGTSADWKLDPEELALAFTDKTALLLLNNPNNPLGKIFSRGELTYISELCIKHNVVCLSDEAYEWITYQGAEHIRIATLPGMWERTITISSAGKLFGATGWKLGWSVGPAHLIYPLMIVNQACSFGCCTYSQEALAEILDREVERFQSGLHNSQMHILPNVLLLPKRDQMVAMLKDAGMVPVIPEAGNFMVADWTKLGITDEMIEDGSTDCKDFKFVRWLITKKKLAVVPCSAFYGPCHAHIARNFVRVCFFKSEETLEKAAGKLKCLQ